MPSVTGVMDNRMTEGLTQLRSVFLLGILISIYNQGELDSSFFIREQSDVTQTGSPLTLKKSLPSSNGLVGEPE